MNRYLIAGNWKMNTELPDALFLTHNIVDWIADYNNLVEVLICPPFINLSEVAKIINNTEIKLGAQNCHWIEKGAYTGEISCPMLKSIGCSHVIIGHSERRQYFHETDETVNLKIKAALSSGLIPVVCIGETLEERKSSATYSILERQIQFGLGGLMESDVSSLVLAYEPVWAIGTGIAATKEQVDEAHNNIRQMLIKEFGPSANDTLILYGGSVTETNALELLALDNVNGALVGGASLKAESFIKIYNSAYSLL